MQSPSTKKRKRSGGSETELPSSAYLTIDYIWGTPEIVYLKIKVNGKNEIFKVRVTTTVETIIDDIKEEYGLNGLYVLYGTLTAYKTRKTKHLVAPEEQRLIDALLEDHGKNIITEEELTWTLQKHNLDRDLNWVLEEHDMDYKIPEVRDGYTLEVKSTKHVIRRKFEPDLSAARVSKFTKLELVSIEGTNFQLAESPGFWFDPDEREEDS